MERHKTTTFHLLLHTKFCDLVRWTVFIGAMLKKGYGKKVYIQGFENKQTNLHTIFKGLVKLQKHFETLHDLNDSDEKTRMLKTAKKKFEPIQKLCKF